MSRINSFERFSKVYENEVVSQEELINKAKEEMPLEDVVADAAQLTDPSKSDIIDRMEQAAQAQAEPEAEDSLRENYTSGEELMKPESMDVIMKGCLEKLPVLTEGARKVIHRGTGVDIPAGAQYKAQSFRAVGSYYMVDYKDLSGRYQAVSVPFKPEAEEIEHLKMIFEDLAKKSKWLDFVYKTATYGGFSLALMGFGLAMFGIIRTSMSLSGNDSWLASGGGGYDSGGFSWDKIAPIGGYEAATGGALFLTGVAGISQHNTLGKKSDAFDASISRLASVLKAFLEPAGMSIKDVKTVADLNAIINTPPTPPTQPVAVEVDSKMGRNIGESKNTKFGNLKRF